MLAEILKVDLMGNDSSVWIVQIRRPDGRLAQIQLAPHSFHTMRSCPMGQFLFHAWLTKASVLPEAIPPNPTPR